MKYYRARTQEEYVFLMQKLEDEGYVWGTTQTKPTEENYWSEYREKTVDEVHEGFKEISYTDIYYYGETIDDKIIEVSDLMDTVDHDTLMQKVVERNNKPEAYTPPNTGDPWIDNLPESYFEMSEEESKTDKYARHKEFTDYMHKTYVSKNRVYGNSFERTHKEIGKRASLGRIADKFYRLQNIILNDEQHVEDETVKDTLIDMANYAIMFAMELEEEHETEV